jgi:hypothetical protein
MARDAGAPTGIVHYFALDIDPNSLSSAQWNAVAAYLDAARDYLRPKGDDTGIYSNDRGVDKMVPAHCNYGWQTYAWSGGRRTSKAHLYQWKNGVSTCGGEIDYNEICQSSYGGWKQAGGAGLAPEEADDVSYENWTDKGKQMLLDDISRMLGEGKKIDGTKPDHLVYRSANAIRDAVDLVSVGDGRDKDLSNDTHGDMNVRAANDRLSLIINALEKAAEALTPPPMKKL